MNLDNNTALVIIAALIVIAYAVRCITSRTK